MNDQENDYPFINKEYFKCPSCFVFAQHVWEHVSFVEEKSEFEKNEEKLYIHVSRCYYCGNKTVWMKGKMIYPDDPYPAPSEYIPENILKLYH